jgi:hypothetical protein
MKGQLSCSIDPSAGGAHVIQLPDAEADLALVRGSSHELKIACDELHDDPFDPDARAHLLRLILHDSKAADGAKRRLRRT